ncbi:hypothetical protein HMPREF0631_0669 [Peptostreptococcus anaerobius 653-L]|uniref:Uncharacterized protein n=1 Tax=Peptostreptococcus anaerobius 653-L TaxID=596329 RepID=D3MSS6_9FIRM|nr:hypothetical protein HMPREF0631_0669 [Peptostreptococcus anaerobius 653-L]
MYFNLYMYFNIILIISEIIFLLLIYNCCCRLFMICGNMRL